jgi:hypothetical protein
MFISSPFRNIWVTITAVYSVYSAYSMIFNGSKQSMDFNTLLMQQISDPNSILMQQIGGLNTSQLFESLNITSLNTSQLSESLYALLDSTKEDQHNSIQVIKDATKSLQNINQLKDIINTAKQRNSNNPLGTIIDFSSNVLRLTKIEIIRALQRSEESKTPEQILNDLNVTEESLNTLIQSEQEKIRQSQTKIKAFTDALERLKEKKLEEKNSQTHVNSLSEVRNQEQQSNQHQR